VHDRIRRGHGWHRIVRASVRECLDTWGLQAQAEPVTTEALEAVLARASVPILRQLKDKPPPNSSRPCSRVWGGGAARPLRLCVLRWPGGSQRGCS